MTNPNYVDLPGSERAPHPLATTTGQPPVDAEEQATVTIVPANNAAIPAIIAFATENNLTTSIEHGLVKATGRLADLQAAFDTQLSAAVTDTGRAFRHRVGPLRIPANLLKQITAVLGLDNREQAQPRFVSAAATPKAFTATQVASLYQFPAGDGAGRTIDIIELGGGFGSADLQNAGLDPSLDTGSLAEPAAWAPSIRYASNRKLLPRGLHGFTLISTALNESLRSKGRKHEKELTFALSLVRLPWCNGQCHLPRGYDHDAVLHARWVRVASRFPVGVASNSGIRG